MASFSRLRIKRRATLIDLRQGPGKKLTDNRFFYSTWKRGLTMSRLTHDRVIEIAGTLTDSQIARILECAADETALLAAMEWVNADDYIGREKHEEPSGTIALLCKILESEEPPPEESRD